ncbi:DUF6544 family protein [Lunatimonas salinarum]|uniref:DUF6544 family protein n=1 Tax=Lunatimonas salinarum TaxID=1774590 RepID=UPI001ADF6A79|nr:DUF6544 family protein [Lunatimonas salinarum]
MRILFCVLLFVHGLIHLLGFVKGFGLKEVKELTMSVSRPMGLLWLLAALLILGFAWQYWANAKLSWVLGFAAVGLSQVLIGIYWSDAKFGTLPNVAMILVVITLAGSYWFQGRIAREKDQLISSVNRSNSIPVTEESIRNLPKPVQRWLRRSGVLGKPTIQVGKVTQRAQMKLRPEQQHWMDASAVQYSTADPPGFIWSVNVKMNAFLSFQGRDRFQEGTGEMLIKLNSLFNIVNERGEKLDEGSLQRYLGEVVWFPTMALSPCIAWETLTDSSAKATMEFMGTQGSGVFHFSPEGDFIRFSAMRFRGNEAGASRSEWVLDVEDYRSFEGVRVPSQMTATWLLDTGEWTWLKLELVDLTYDQASN